MAGVSGKQGTFGIAKQSALGSAASAPTAKFYFRDTPSFGLTRNVARFEMTDTSRDLGKSYIASVGVAGDVPLFAHPDGMAILLAGALGANADSGSTPNYTHTITPSTDVFYHTVWISKAGASLVEKFQDVKINTLGISGSANSPLEVSLNLIGTTGTYLASDTASTMQVAADPFVYMEAKANLKFATVAQKVHQFNFEINNNISPYFSDDYLAGDVDPGQREVTFNFNTRYTTPTGFPDYKDFFWDGSNNPVVTVGSDVAVDFTWVRNSNLSTELQMPSMKYAAIPVQPNVAGTPIEIAVGCTVEKGSNPIVTAIVKDQKATPWV